MITPSFSLTATERVLPKLALDFTTASLDARVTFTRTTDATHPATYTNNSGYVTSATNNQPRFDYDPVTLACKGLLIEESRTNLVIQSNGFNTSDWTKSGCTVGTAAVTSPGNDANSFKIEEDTSTGLHRLIPAANYSVTSGTRYYYTIYAKKAERDFLYLLGGGTPLSARYCVFDLNNGTVGVSSNVTGSISSAGNGWYRCTMTFVPGSTGTASVNICAKDANNTTNYTGITGYGIYVYGAQLEVGEFSTSYIPTTSAALTRNADVATMTGTNFSSWYNASEGSFVARAAYVGLATSKPIFTVNTDGSNYFGVLTAPSTVADARGVMLTSGATQTAINMASVFTAGSFSKVCYTYKTNNCAFSANGLATSSDPTATIPTVDKLDFGKLATIQSSLWISNLNYYPQRLTNAEVQAFSK